MAVAVCRPFLFADEEKPACFAADFITITNQITCSSFQVIYSKKITGSEVMWFYGTVRHQRPIESVQITYLNEEFFLLFWKAFNNSAAVSEMRFFTAERRIITCGSLDSMTLVTNQHQSKSINHIQLTSRQFTLIYSCV